jgi:hypothetical protein
MLFSVSAEMKRLFEDEIVKKAEMIAGDSYRLRDILRKRCSL